MYRINFCGSNALHTPKISVQGVSFFTFTSCGHVCLCIQSVRHPSWFRDLARLRAKANRISFTFSPTILFVLADWSCTVVILSLPVVPTMSEIYPSPRSSSMLFSNSYVSSDVRTMSFDSNSGKASVSRVIQKLEKKNRKLTTIFLGDEGREYFYWAHF